MKLFKEDICFKKEIFWSEWFGWIRILNKRKIAQSVVLKSGVEGAPGRRWNGGLWYLSEPFEQ